MDTQIILPAVSDSEKPAVLTLIYDNADSEKGPPKKVSNFPMSLTFGSYKVAISSIRDAGNSNVSTSKIANRAGKLTMGNGKINTISASKGKGNTTLNSKQKSTNSSNNAEKDLKTLTRSNLGNKTTDGNSTTTRESKKLTSKKSDSKSKVSNHCSNDLYHYYINTFILFIVEREKRCSRSCLIQSFKFGNK